jgi:hypothetical protein
LVYDFPKQEIDRTVKLHPSDLLLQDVFGAAGLPTGERRALLDHLLGCRRCRERLRDLRPRLRNPLPAEYDAVLDRGARYLQDWRSAFDRERDEAPRLIARLLDQPPERREILLRNSAQFRTWPLAELLLARSAETALRDSHPAEELARLALQTAKALDSSRYGKARIHDLQARSWAHIGNALRTRSELTAASAAFANGKAHLRKGAGEFLEKRHCSNWSPLCSAPSGSSQRLRAT